MKFSHPLILSAACAIIAITAISAPAKASSHHARMMVHGAMMPQDLDKNGTLSLEEFLAPKENRFTLIDSNKDGSLSAKELAAAPAATDARARRMKDWLAKADDADKAMLDARQARTFRGLDANSDGAISREEYLAMDVLKFAALDKNNDGEVDLPSPHMDGDKGDGHRSPGDDQNMRGDRDGNGPKG
jgi:Ca2+-binding EF-hand superfamily protein